MWEEEKTIYSTWVKSIYMHGFIDIRYECSVMLLIGNVLCCTVYQGNTPFTEHDE